MREKLTLSLSAIALVAACGYLIAARAQSNPAPHAAAGATTSQGAEKKAEEQFKNIQTLKGIPADQLIPTMQFISASLGVECEFCHVQGAFEKDDKKPKQTARKMIEMMFEINADNFDRNREVTCYSCHRGSIDPIGMPPVMTEEPKGMGEAKKAEENGEKKDAKASAEPAPDLLLDKYVQADGGAAALNKITSRVMKGTIDFGGRSAPIEIYCKNPDKRISFAHMPDGDSVTAFNGNEGWLGMAGRPLREMHGGDLDGAAIDADLQLATHLKAMFSEMSTTGTEKIGEHETYVVTGQRTGKPPVQLYFDEQTGLLVRMVRFGETALGRLPTQIDYADYRDADGVKIAYRWTLARPGGRFTIQVSELQQNVPVDDAKFIKPAPSAGHPAADHPPSDHPSDDHPSDHPAIGTHTPAGPGE
jgi:photosynthetic reaction center cytochrome c subunit